MALDSLEKKLDKIAERIEKHGRGGKTVTIVDGFVGTHDDLKQLAKTLKTACGVGGNAKDDLIIIQGEQKEKIVEILKKNGYTNSK